MSVISQDQPALDREAADELIRVIWHASVRLAGSGLPNLVPRAREIEALAHFMLYDADGGIEDDR
jgi:hypothetical protein